MRSMLFAALMLFLAQPLLAQPLPRPREIVQATVRLSNPKSTATGFILGLPKAKGAESGQFVLITAAHALIQAEGNELTVNLRRATSGGEFAREPHVLKIREEGKPLWTQHAKQDVAAIKIKPPEGVDLPRLELDILAADGEPKTAEAGDLVRCVVFPHGGVFEASPAGFPILRLGCIASYPLPSPDKQQGFLVDYNTFEGDSGGPVYWTTTDDEGKPTVKILGLIKGQHWINQRYELIYESGEIRKQLGLAIAEPAAVIRETVQRLIPE